MQKKELNALTKRGLSLLVSSAGEWKAIKATRLQGTRFSLSFRHEVARCARSESLALIASLDKKPDLRIGMIRSARAITTLDSRVVFDLVRPIHPGSLSALLAQVTESSLRNHAAKLGNSAERFRSVSPKLGERLIELISADAENAAVLRRIMAHLSAPTRFENARAMQQDAVHLALKAFGADDGAAELAVHGSTSLEAIRLQEDAVIEHDARWIPGWDLADSDLTGRAVFRQQDDQLTVFTANKRPLEELFGVDLIYLNETRRALVMVQYKMMERGQRHVETGPFLRSKIVDQEWMVPINKQFQAELDRMACFDRDLSPDGTYRLNSGAFFFKLIKRNAGLNTAGIVLSLGHLKQLIADGEATGPKGGLRISYKTLDGHYLRSDPFVGLIGSGYIGTREATTEHLTQLINAALSGGRAVVAAMQSAMSPVGGATLAGNFGSID